MPTIIDLRSDTVTRPTQDMLEAMYAANVGDDVFGEDPTVNALQTKVAAIFGMEAGLFCPSGTMTNQIGIRVHTQPQDEVICDKRSHIYLYEGGGTMANSGVSVRLLEGDRGLISPEMITDNINADDVHFPVSRLVVLENTCNKGGGSCYSLAQMQAIHQTCQQNGLALHLDGARIFNALIATGDNALQYGACFDTISVCLSKGLGAPVGSVLVGSHAHIKKAKRVRKAMGGGMRQAGFLAAAGIYALDHHVTRLQDDHQKAQVLAAYLGACALVVEIFPVETNIVIFKVHPAHLTSKSALEKFAENGLKAAAFGPQHIRLVTHLDFSETQLEQTCAILHKCLN